MKRIICWWFGCKTNDNRDYFADHESCVRCGAEDISYADLVGDTKHNRLRWFFAYWFFRKWIPMKCVTCGKRFGDHYNCLPF